MATDPRRSAAISTQAGFSIEPGDLRATVERALREDLGAGDATSRLTIPAGASARGNFVGQQDFVLAGLPVVAEVFRQLDPSSFLEARVEEGAEAREGTVLATAIGPARALLAGERVALNFLQHLSGIATETRAFNNQLRGLKTVLLDTRKTLPGLRALEKYAVRVGGGTNHRMRLDDGILIKNNHLRLAGGIREAVERAKRARTAEARQLRIEVEVSTVSELEEALAAGAEALLLDNMTPEEVRRCVERVQGRIPLEASGGINKLNTRAYAETGVDFISVGALTHSAPAVDIHFLAEPLQE